MDFIFILKQMTSLMLMMLIGYVLYMTKTIDKIAIERYSRLVLNVTLPAQIVASFAMGHDLISKSEVFLILSVSAFVYVIFGVIAIVFNNVFAVRKERKSTFTYMMLFGNTGFMGFPVVIAIFGADKLIYAAIFNIMFYALSFSLGIKLLAKNETKFSPKLLLNMPLVCTFIAIILFYANLRLPQMIIDTLNSVGSATTPIAMILLGATIASMPFRTLFNDWRIYFFTAVKLFVLPICVLLVLMRFSVLSPVVRNVIFVLAGTPVAANGTMIAIEYGGDIELIGKGIFFTTVISAISIPLITLLIS